MRFQQRQPGERLLTSLLSLIAGFFCLPVMFLLGIAPWFPDFDPLDDLPQWSYAGGILLFLITAATWLIVTNRPQRVSEPHVEDSPNVSRAPSPEPQRAPVYRVQSQPIERNPKVPSTRLAQDAQ